MDVLNCYIFLIYCLQNDPCSSTEADSVFAIQSGSYLPDCRRLLHLKLVACNMSPKNWEGVYECRLNRSSEDPILLWSATILPGAAEPIVTGNFSKTVEPLNHTSK